MFFPGNVARPLLTVVILYIALFTWNWSESWPLIPSRFGSQRRWPNFRISDSKLNVTQQGRYRLFIFPRVEKNSHFPMSFKCGKNAETVAYWIRWIYWVEGEYAMIFPPLHSFVSIYFIAAVFFISARFFLFIFIRCGARLFHRKEIKKNKRKKGAGARQLLPSVTSRKRKWRRHDRRTPRPLRDANDECSRSPHSHIPTGPNGYQFLCVRWGPGGH